MAQGVGPGIAASLPQLRNLHAPLDPRAAPRPPQVLRLPFRWSPPRAHSGVGGLGPMSFHPTVWAPPAAYPR